MQVSAAQATDVMTWLKAAPWQTLTQVWDHKDILVAIYFGARKMWKSVESAPSALAQKAAAIVNDHTDEILGQHKIQDAADFESVRNEIASLKNLIEPRHRRAHAGD